MLLTPRIEAGMKQANWDKVSADKVAKCSLSLNLFHEQDINVSLWRSSYQTSSGTIVSLFALSAIILLLKLSVLRALEVVIITQAVRTLWLLHKTLRANSVKCTLEDDVISELAEISGDGHQ